MNAPLNRQSTNVAGGCATKWMTFEASIIDRSPRESKSRWDQSDISAKGSHQVAPKITAVPISGQLSPHLIAPRTHLLSELNNLHLHPVWYQACLSTNVTTKEATHDKRSEQEFSGACGQ